jgi:WD40 repeat protein
VAWSPDGKRLATASEDGTVRIWDSATGIELSDIRLASPVWQAAWSPNGLQLATTNAAGLAQVWDVSSGKEAFTLQGKTLESFDIAWSPDGKFLATTGGAEFSIRIWDATPFTLTLSGDQKGIIWTSWSPDGRRIATSALDKTAVIWDARTGKPLLTFVGHSSDVQDVFWSPDGSRIVTTGWDNLAKVWDANTGDELLTFTGHVGESIAKFNGVEALFGGGWSPDGTRIMTLGGDGSVRVWDARTGEEYLVFQATKDLGASALWSPDGASIASCAAPGVLQLWDAATGKSIFGGYVHNTADLSFGDAFDGCFLGGWSPDGKKILTTSWGGNGATIWNAETGEKIFVFTGHTGGIGFSTWSPNGKRIASGDTNGEVKIWDTDTGAVLFSFSVPVENILFQLAWSPDGRHLTGANLSDSIEIYRVWQTTEDLIADAKECCVVRELTPEERQQFGLP